MNKKTILEISLYAQYYKKDITDRHMINNKSLIITNDAIDILDKPQEKLYIEPWTKKIEKDKEIERLNKECDTYMKIATKKDNIINELEKWLKNEIYDLNGDYDAEGRVAGYESVLNKLKELKEKSDI